MVQDRPIVQPNAVYSREQVAELLGVSLATIKRLIAEGHLMASKPGGTRRVLIRGSYILKMLDQNLVESRT